MLSNDAGAVDGEGKPHASVMLVGEAPGREEHNYGRPFVGQAGRLLDHILNKLGIPRSELYITNCLRCHPKGNVLPKVKELEECWKYCKGFLLLELHEVKPKAVVVLGNTALRLLTGEIFISQWAGQKVTRDKGIDYWACYHPAAALRNPKLEASIATTLMSVAQSIKVELHPKGIEAGMFPYEVRT